MGSTYQGLFLKGFDKEEIEKRGVSIGADPKFFMPCLNDLSKTQVNVLKHDHLKHMLEQHQISPEDCTKIRELFNLGKMNAMEIKEKCIQIRPYMANMFDTWSESPMSTFNLTSVGIAIGHANVKRLVGEFADLSVWIN